LDPQPPVVAHVCDDIACRLTGASDLCAALEERLGPAGTPALGGSASWLTSPCLGLCERAPAVLLQRTGRDDLAYAPASVGGVLAGFSDNLLSPNGATLSGSPSAPQTREPER